jgi:hypothetical protein
MTAVLAAGPCVSGQGPGRVLQASPRAVNVLFGRRVVTLSARGGVVTPSGVVLDVPRVEPPRNPRLDGLRFASEDWGFRLGARSDLYFPTEHRIEPTRARALLEPWVAPFPRSILSALGPTAPTGPRAGPDGALERALFGRYRAVLARAGPPEAIADHLLGVGFGLTPSGDDFLLGLGAILRAAGAPIGPLRTKVAGYGNPFAATLLWDGLSGFYAAPLLAVLRELAAGRLEERTMRALLSTGHTSGHDLLAGMVYATRWLSELGPHLPRRA